MQPSIENGIEGPRRIFARLAVAVMAADGHITASELDTLDRLQYLGLGPLSAIAREEIHYAMYEPIDLRLTCSVLQPVSPPVAATILSALGEVAASDGTISVPELHVLRSIATLLGVPATETAEILTAAANAHGFAAPDEKSPRTGSGARALGPGAAGSGADRPAVPDGNATRPVVVSAPSARLRPAADSPALAAERGRAFAFLGVTPGASRSDLEAAYRVLVERYDPLKVLDLGSEFAALAVRRLGEATRAFEVALGAMARDVGSQALPKQAPRSAAA
jgi:uncharacterized tellurite resistance protein B-like protein